MPAITNEVSANLVLIASEMRPVMMVTHEKHLMTKEELEEMGYVGAEKMPDGKYLYKAPVHIAMNHYRGLKKAYKKDGYKGCSAYIEWVNNLKCTQ